MLITDTHVVVKALTHGLHRDQIVSEEGGRGKKEKDQKWRGIKRTPLCTVFFHLEKSEIYVKMLTNICQF